MGETSSNQEKITNAILMIADISGYTKFIKLHKMSLLHAEKIIIDLLESVIDHSRSPLIQYEVLGDAVTFYAPADKDSQTSSSEVFEQAQQMMSAFRQKEKELVSDCNICVCEACNNIDKLRLKVLLHQGEVLITSIKGQTKIAGENMIMIHRLLKNSVPADEYILMSEEFASDIAGQSADLEKRSEKLDDIGRRNIYVQYAEPRNPSKEKQLSGGRFQRLWMTAKLEWYAFRRLFSRGERSFRNLPS